MITVKEPAGTSKFGVICLLRDLACSNPNEPPMLRYIMIPVDQRGITFTIAFSSSTWSTVHRLHGFKVDPSEARSFFGSLMKQALFRNLKENTASPEAYCYFIQCVSKR